MLGILQQVDIRSYWSNEERDFTPWLAKDENIQVLANEIGLDLDVEGTEQFIGSFKADILARDASDRYVIIENQLEKSDHKHLGQLLTYASGVDARTIIWICREVTAEHRRAMDWLNEHTTTDIGFFACEIELWQIGDSLPAPKFHVIASPNDWAKVVKERSTTQALSPTKQAHLAYWNGFSAYMEHTGTPLRLRTPWPRHWYTVAVGRSNFSIALTTNTQAQQIGCEIYIRGKAAKKAYHQLHAQRTDIEAKLGALEWHELPEGQDCRIKHVRTGNTKDLATWDDLHGWMKERAESFYSVFGPRIKQLSL